MVMLAAVRNDGCALQYAPQRLRADREVVAAALQADPGAIRFAAPQLQQDERILSKLALRP